MPDLQLTFFKGLQKAVAEEIKAKSWRIIKSELFIQNAAELLVFMYNHHCFYIKELDHLIM